ncbi:divalent-cation tolerance protein CutA [Sinimarinibacterium sp. CAU 1509]|uniref:divalent-cation tolerance protein CutA n=1 Tax=Sinimarinibacterium sp. CAU 1509 TaxID=2562283 RepID=UPI0010AB9622|nr:divalent-cation tolerance protein CutA [Sinimarinibacterium sp. CAU 1509]TJY59353.1 divalent-cation tolerance protein CutA [Sinimarinibacterium sp. CAU 1509]
MESTEVSTTGTAIALVTCPPEHAEALARALIERRVAACVNIVPAIRSIYRWQDGVVDDSESLLLIKHPSAGFAALRDCVLEQHPYELPEIVAVNLDWGHTPYLDWIRSACS